MESSYKGSKEEGEEFAIDDLEIFENVAYIMAYHADNTIPDNIDDWLDQFEMFSIYEVLPEILALWGTNLITEYYGAAEPPVRCGESHLSGLTEPPHFIY